MTFIKIFKVGDPYNTSTFLLLPEGEHTIGREFFQSNDKRISRKHATITIGKDNVTLKSEHVNPCFYKSTDNTILTLSKDKTINISNNDHFALVSDRFWFRVQVITENYSKNMNVGTKPPINLSLSSMKRNTDDYIFSNKKQKISECDEASEHSECDMEIQREVENNDACNDKCDKQNAHNLNNKVMSVNLLPENSNGESSENVPNDSNDTKKQSGDKDVDKQNIETGTEDKDRSLKEVNKGQAINPRRDRCWYGQECYRKNVQHRNTFSHPGDNDYDSDPEDNRPHCSYGNACYRINVRHRREFKHRGRPAPKPRNFNQYCFCMHLANNIL